MILEEEGRESEESSLYICTDAFDTERKERGLEVENVLCSYHAREEDCQTNGDYDQRQANSARLRDGFAFNFVFGRGERHVCAYI